MQDRNAANEVMVTKVLASILEGGLSGERQKWWHGGAGLTERSEQGSLSAVATHVLLGFLIFFGVTCR